MVSEMVSCLYPGIGHFFHLVMYLMKKMLHSLALLVFVFYGTGVQAQLHSKKSPDQQPNIIFILTDDLGYGDIGIFHQNARKLLDDRSKPWTSTPEIDRMAGNGARLMQHYAAAPVCAPSRASIISGLNQGHANVRDNQFDNAIEDNYNMANLLRAAGYETAAIGKWGLQGHDKAWVAQPLNRGFDYYFGYMRHKDGHEHYPKEGLYDGSKEVWDNHRNVAADLDKCYTADLWTAAAKKWIYDHARKRRKKGKASPFFLYLAYDTPHAALELPTQPYPAGKGLKGGMQWLGQPGHMINTASGAVDHWIHPDYAQATYDDDHNPATAEVPWPDTYKRYATAVRRIDDCVGDLLQLLKDLHLDDNTLVVFTSDNGPSIESYLPSQYVPIRPTFFESYGPFDGIKRDCWEGGERMPTIVSWPARIKGNQVVNSPNISYDWLPTFCEAAGMVAPVRSDGVSLLPVLTGKGSSRDSKVYVEYFEPGKTPPYPEFEKSRQGRLRRQMQLIRLGNYVGVRYDIHSAGDDFEIYDVVNDPKEKTNLGGLSEMKKLQKGMKEMVLQERRPDTGAARPYDKDLVPAVTIRESTPGVQWAVFKNAYQWIPDPTYLSPQRKGYAPAPGKEALPVSDYHVICYEGLINVPSDGSYTFYLHFDKGAFLRIHDCMVIDADYGAAKGGEKSGTIRLQAGLHPFKLYYNQGSGYPLQNSFQWESDKINRETIPAAVFRHSLTGKAVLQEGQSKKNKAMASF